MFVISIFDTFILDLRYHYKCSKFSSLIKTWSMISLGRWHRFYILPIFKTSEWNISDFNYLLAHVICEINIHVFVIDVRKFMFLNGRLINTLMHFDFSFKNRHKSEPIFSRIWICYQWNHKTLLQHKRKNCLLRTFLYLFRWLCFHGPFALSFLEKVITPIRHVEYSKNGRKYNPEI